MPHKDPEVRRARARERYAKDPSKYKKMLEWREKNPDQWAAIQERSAKKNGRTPEENRTYYQENKEQIKAKAQQWRKKNHAKYILSRLRRRAQEQGLPFDLSEEDVHIPEYCPVLGLKLEVLAGGQRDTSPSVDRLIPARGYVKGNICVISMKANRIKNDATEEDLLNVLAYIQSHDQS